jgi:hypothetical protein
MRRTGGLQVSLVRQCIWFYPHPNLIPNRKKQRACRGQLNVHVFFFFSLDADIFFRVTKSSISTLPSFQRRRSVGNIRSEDTCTLCEIEMVNSFEYLSRELFIAEITIETVTKQGL